MSVTDVKSLYTFTKSGVVPLELIIFKSALFLPPTMVFRCQSRVTPWEIADYNFVVRQRADKAVYFKLGVKNECIRSLPSM